MNLRISKVFGSRGGATEILTMISVKRCQFLAISEDWTNVYACCSFKLFINNEFLVYFYSLDLALIIYVTNIRQFHVSQFWHVTGPISPFVVPALLSSWGIFLKFTCDVVHKPLVSSTKSKVYVSFCDRMSSVCMFVCMLEPLSQFQWNLQQSILGLRKFKLGEMNGYAISEER